MFDIISSGRISLANTSDAVTKASSALSVDMLTKIIMGVVIALSALIVLMLVLRIRKTKHYKKVVTWLLILLMVINIGATIGINRYNVLVNQYLAGETVSEEETVDVTANSREMTKLLQDEGIVLLKNNSNALPVEVGNVNVFGYASQSIVYGGSGSGAGEEADNITLKQGLENAGYMLNNDLIQLYKRLKPEKAETNIFELVGGNFHVYEHGLNEYSDELINSAKSFSDTAIVVFARSGGEGGDLPIDMAEYEGGSPGKNYLELTDNELALLDMVKDNFGKVIIVINSSNAMELGFVDDEAVDAALWIGGPGSTGLNSLGRVLSGEVNPSGRLVDTYAYDATSSPAYYNAGDFTYLNTLHEETNQMGTSNEEYYKFLNYAEGIYVGYRYYETRYVDNESGQIDEAAYRAAVQYPFGYGLSYTEFTQKMGDLKISRNEISVDVVVTNTGSVAGKEVVQLYYTAPYTVGGIEKSHVVLAAFAKTQLLNPGESESVKLSFAIEDMASYDYVNAEAYVLEAGDYQIKLMNNAHDVIDSREYNVDETVVYGEDSPRRSDVMSATNRFDEAAGDVVYLSRADWASFPAERTKDKNASDELVAQLQDTSVQGDTQVEDIVFEDHEITLSEMTGLDYNDPKWDDLLEQLTIDEMKTLIGFGGFQTAEIQSIDKLATIDIDGPAGLNGLVNKIRGVQFCSETVIGSTWNVDLAQQMGTRLGEEAVKYKVSGLYAPGVNIHRTPFSGRNFEYYSEDSMLSGKMGAATIRGGRSVGVGFYPKHFALNDQETNRLGMVTWSNEQAIRELYLKPFEITVKEAGTNGMMSSFNRIGVTWAGANKALLTDILRNEWGFNGMVISDYVLNPVYMNVNQAIVAGNDLMLSTMGTKVIADTPYQRQNMRKASHNILFAVANREVQGTGIASWLYWYCVIEVVLLAAIAVGIIFATRKKAFQVIKADTE